LKVKLVNPPVDHYPADILLVYFFSRERPLKGETGRIDWWLEGHLSKNLMSGWIRGDFSEKLLSNSARRIASPRILLNGLGPQEHFTAERYQALVQLIAQTVAGMGLNKLVTPLPGFHLPSWTPDITPSLAAELLVEAVALAFPALPDSFREPEMFITAPPEKQDEIFLGAQQVKVNLKGRVDLEVRVGE